MSGVLLATLQKIYEWFVAVFVNGIYCVIVLNVFTHYNKQIYEYKI